MSGWPIQVFYVPPGRFFGRRWHRYAIPVRITLKDRDVAVYRWLFWNFTLVSGLVHLREGDEL